MSLHQLYITHHILQVPIVSVDKAAVRHKRLLTMAPPKKTVITEGKGRKEYDKYLRRLAWCNQTGLQCDESEEQYSLLPRALAEVGVVHTMQL